MTTQGEMNAYRATLYARFGKPLLDRTLGLLLTIIMLPVFGVLAVLCRSMFGGPAIRRVTKVGKNDTRFVLYKFVTDETSTAESAQRHRRLGSFLRERSLDELPQLWNVVLGHLSLVGPRPITPAVAAELDDWQLQRHQVKPGLTGLWQVEARGDARDLRDNIHYDIQYIDLLSLAVDLRLLVRTMTTLITRREGDNGLQPPRDRIRTRLPHIRLVTADVIVWVLAMSIAAAGRFDFNWSLVNQRNLVIAALVAVTAQLAWGYSVGLYRGRWRLGSYEEISWVAAGSALIATGLLATTLITSTHILSRGAIIAAAGFQLVGALGARYMARAVYAAQGKSIHRRPHKMLVFGAGSAGLKAAEAIWQDKEADALPVAFLDDDPVTWKRHPLGLSVVGGREAVRDAARRYNADVLLIAMPSAHGAAIESVATAAQGAGLQVRILPRLAKFVDGNGAQVLTSDIRGLTLSDFLNREEIRLDLDEIAGYLAGKRVLITGAGGSIGSVLCTIVDQFNPKQVVKLDHDENALHALQLKTEGRALLESEDLVLCDIRDREAVFRVFEDIKPEVVFHTAAHKHVTFLERHPQEAIKTNVHGTLNMLEAAHEFGVERFVNISTDKAANPENMLGLTKRVAEMLTSYFDENSKTSYLSVRFGNVLGSNGSVIPTFRKQIEEGEPITVTDPEVTRFFMTIEEACQLVVQAGAIGGHGDVYVLDMGEPVRIVELAKRLQQHLRPGTEADIVFTGLRPGEKLHEVLAGPFEELVGQPHELLDHYAVPALDPAAAGGLLGSHDFEATRRRLEDLVGTHRI